MKKLLMKIFVVVITLIVMNTFLYSLPYEQLGNFLSSEIIGYNVAERRWVSILYFQFGMVTRGFGGDDFIYLYGSEDLPGMGKRRIEITANNEVTNFYEKVYYVYVYEAKDIAAPNPIQHKILNGEVDFKIQNLDLKLEKGKLYFIVFCDGKGAVLDVKKIIVAE